MLSVICPVFHLSAYYLTCVCYFYVRCPIFYIFTSSDKFVKRNFQETLQSKRGMPDSQHYSLPLHLYLINNVGEIIVFLAWNFLPCFYIEKLQFKGAVVNLTCYSIIRESLGIKSTIQIIVFHWIVLIFRSDQIHIFLLENLFLLKSKILTNNLICLILCLPDFCLFQETKKTLFLTNYFFYFFI